MCASSVSIVIPSRNYGHFLGQALESALAQTWSDKDVLVVDDGSTDNTADIVHSFGSRVRYVRTTGLGAYGARNFSLDHVQGDFFLNLDADNVLSPDFIEKTICFFQEGNDPALGFVYSQRELFGDSTGFSSYPEFDPQLLKFSNYVDMCSLVRMDLVRRFRFDESFNSGCGDHDFFLTLASHGYCGTLVDEPLLKYRVHNQSITSGVRRRYDHVPIMKRLIAKHHTLYSPAEKRRALAEATNRTLVAICANRRKDAPVSVRFRDLLWFMWLNPMHHEFLRQIVYFFSPSKDSSF